MRWSAATCRAHTAPRRRREAQARWFSLAHSNFDNPGTWFGSVTEQPLHSMAQFGHSTTAITGINLASCRAQRLRRSCLSRKGREAFVKEEVWAGAVGMRQSI